MEKQKQKKVGGREVVVLKQSKETFTPEVLQVIFCPAHALIIPGSLGSN